MSYQPHVATLLIVEDNVSTRELIIEYLRPQKYHILVASNGQEALDTLHQASVDLVVSDILMPVMDGYSLLAAVQSDLSLKNIPVIVVSAIGDLQSVLRCLELGADDYLYKPINRVLLMARVTNSLEKKFLRDREMARLQEINTMKDQVVSTLAHEMKNPLALIMGFIELLIEDAGLSPDSREYVQHIQRYAFQMNELVQDLLDLSKLDITLHKERADIVRLCKSTIEDLRLLATQKHIELTCEASDTLCIAEFDVERIRRVVSNLLSNAIKYTPKEGHVTVTITQSDDSLQVSVQDDGLGIPNDELERIFESFYRIKRPEHMANEGTGLGLSIAKTIIEQHNGRLWVESELGVGSKFSFEIPCA